MIFLDSDHITVLRYPEDQRHVRLRARIDAAMDQLFATTVISLEEQMRGWLALIHRTRAIHEQIPAYNKLADLVNFFGRWQIVRLDSRAADKFEELRSQRIRIGTQDLKIASIALVNDALLLSANLRDFRRVPNLRVESWIE